MRDTEIEKRAAHLFFPPDSKTVTDHQQLKKAICAVAFTHTRFSDRSLVFLALAFGNQVQPPLVVARFYRSTSLPHPTASGPQLGKHHSLRPEIILRLWWRVVNGQLRRTTRRPENSSNAMNLCQ